MSDKLNNPNAAADGPPDTVSVKVRNLIAEFLDQLPEINCPVCSSTNFYLATIDVGSDAVEITNEFPYLEPTDNSRYSLSCNVCGFHMGMRYKPFLKWVVDNKKSIK